MPHDHGHHHHHHHVDPESGDARVAAAVGVNLFLTVAQIVAGLVSGSLAMIADAIHNLSDAASLAIAYVARKIARRPADASMTFGYRRAEVVAALINYTTLVVIGLWLAWEAVARFFAPEPVAGWIVVIVAGIALVVDLATAALTYAMSKDSVNIRAAFMHNLADAAGSLAVIVAGVLILLFGWMWVDPALTLMLSAYILYMSLSEMPGVIRILMLGSPPQIEPEEVIAEARGISGVADVHHAHLWQMDERRVSLEAHVVVEQGAWDRADAIKADVKARLSERFGIGHTTLEMECSHHACEGEQVFGAA
ncbi:cation diffusion facilitator family transporter [Roseivivax halodurans JCM 10272]|uniref:Cation diffusion facilitator family transporter n=1 Tax=Roseivivax halodurans JCM 10272 TaxID=1449350 RepID=X7EEA3_9RHOB|nr:cation diffusion facilitator family transporter [Roseivivax halodurans]ETX14215.1 cation diffusion facilitator family transporter [Roseivivax halodurans JCM 10272]